MNDKPKTARTTVKVEVVLHEKYLYVIVCQVPYKNHCVYAKIFVVLPGGKNDYTGWAYDDLRKLGQGSHEIEYRR